MNVSLSNTDLEKRIPNVITYGELRSMNIDELMRKIPMALLYETSEHYGHWVLLHKTPEGIEFFDSYGFKPDREEELIPQKFRQPHMLSALLRMLSQTIPINYNQYRFQEKETATCGRWVLMRHELSHKTIDEFKRGVDRICAEIGVTPDEFSVMATNHL